VWVWTVENASITNSGRFGKLDGVVDGVCVAFL